MSQKRTFHTHAAPLGEDEEPEKEEVPQWAATIGSNTAPMPAPTSSMPTPHSADNSPLGRGRGGLEVGQKPASGRWMDRKVPALAVVVIFLLFIFSASGFAWAFYSYKTVSAKISQQPGAIINSGQSAEQQKKKKAELLDKISKLILLPMGEDPIIATIIDALQLKKDQVFYANAKNGDIVLVYSEAKKAFLYNPNQNIIVNVGPVIAEKSSTVTPSSGTVIPTEAVADEGSIPINKNSSTSSTQKLNVEIRNGTNVAGLGVKLSWALKNDDFSVVKVSNAVMNYPNSVIVNLTKKTTNALVKKLEDQFKVKAITKIPPEESSSTAQVLIFIGTDYANQI